MLRPFVSGLLLIALLAPELSAAAQPVMVFAGSASQPPLEEAAKAFEAQTGTPVVLHFGGSGAMLSQIRLTGLGDLYIPGSPDYLEKARQLDLVEEEFTVLAYLVPAILVPRGNPQQIRQLEDLTRPGLRIGMADPAGVCVGLYAVELLERSGLSDRIRPNLHGFVESCAKTASMLPLGTVDAVLGWREFAAWRPDRMDAILLQNDEIPRLAYIPGARLHKAGNPDGAAAFLAYLGSAAGQAIFQKWGYDTEETKVRQLAPLARIGGSYTLPEDW